MKSKNTFKHTSDALQSKSRRDKCGVSRLSLSTLKKRCWQQFSLYIRMRDCLKTTGCSSFGLCVTCGKRYHIKLLQAGHFVSGRHNANLFSEEGVHGQCRSCNIWGHGNPLEYRRAIIDLYGDGYDEVLEKEAREIKKYTIDDYKEIEETYKNKYQELLDNYNKR